MTPELPGMFVKSKIPRPHSELMESESLGWEPREYAFLTTSTHNLVNTEGCSCLFSKSDSFDKNVWRA